MTLVEALVAVALIGIITSAIAGALVVTIGPDGQTSDRLAASHDTQLASLYLPTDLQSAGNAAGDVVIDGSVPFSCASLPAHRTVLWLHQAGTGFEVAYVVLDSAPAELIRYECTSTGFSTVVVAHHLDGALSSATAVANPDGTYSLLLVIRVDADATPVSVEIAGRSRVRDGDLALPTVASSTTTIPIETTTTVGATTTSAGVTTTTTTTTTTTPCAAAVSARPSSVTRNASSGKLTADVVLTVTLSGSCSPSAPTVTYQVNTTSSTTASGSTTGSGTTWTHTIGRNTHSTWNNGAKSVQVFLGSTSLGVFPAVFTVTS